VGIFRSAGEGRWLSYSLALLARLRTGQERLDEARALLEEARVARSQLETTYGQPFRMTCPASCPPPVPPATWRYSTAA
jgi:hypothetical protein